MSLKTVSYLSVIVLFMSILSSCYEEYSFEPEIENQNTLVTINNNPVFFDLKNKIALCPVADFTDFEGSVASDEEYAVRINHVDLKMNEVFNFGSIDAESVFVLELKQGGTTVDIFSLQFTLLPVVGINHKYSEIPKDDKILSIFTLFDSHNLTKTVEYCGIECRGGSSSSYDKKSYGLEIHDNAIATDDKNVAFLGMDSDDDWILDAAYIDKSNIRNRVSFDVWKSIQNDGLSRGYDLLPSVSQGRLVEVFINNEYRGIYSLCERIDEKKLNIRSIEVGVQGFLYKSEGWTDATEFKGVEDTTNVFGRWGEWEQKYPNVEVLSCWKPLYELIDFVANASDSVFYHDVSSYLKVDQAIDFFILINLMGGADNTGKNIFLAKKNSQDPFYICPWDMDATWGRNWKAEVSSCKGLMSNEIYRRLMKLNPDHFNNRLTRRWNDLRKTALQNERIIEVFNYYSNRMAISGAYSREEMFWPSSMNEPSVEMEFISDWIVERMKMLDEYFSALNN